MTFHRLRGGGRWTVVVGTRSVGCRAKCSRDHPSFEIYPEK